MKTNDALKEKRLFLDVDYTAMEACLTSVIYYNSRLKETYTWKCRFFALRFYIFCDSYTHLHWSCLFIMGAMLRFNQFYISSNLCFSQILTLFSGFKMYLILPYHILFWKNDRYAGAVELMLKFGHSKIGISLHVKFSECYMS